MLNRGKIKNNSICHCNNQRWACVLKMLLRSRYPRFFHICQRITQFCLRVPHFSNLPSHCAFINVAFAFCISQFAFLFRIPALLYYNFFGFQGLRSHAHVFQILLRAPVSRSSTEKRFALLKLKRGIQRLKDYMSLCCCYSPTTPPPY